VSYRVEELAKIAGVSVELVRSYQTKGLLDPPRRSGRVALYDDRHLDRLRQIRALKDEGHSLKAISAMLERGRPSPSPDRAINAATSPAPHEDEQLDIHELAERTKVPLGLLRSLEASGVIRPRTRRGVAFYTGADVRAVRMLLSLIGVGLPLEEFMRLAHLQLGTMEQVADGAVELFRKYVEEPLLASDGNREELTQRADAAFNLLVQAATSLVAYSFERSLRGARAGTAER
jgi:DNA-binding transcriptional MerR regulator